MGGALQDSDGARPAHRPREPLTRRRASSFCGAGRSTGERKIQDTEAALLLCPGELLPARCCPNSIAAPPRMQEGSGQGIFHREHHYNWPSREEGAWCYWLGLRRCPFFFFFFKF